MLFVFDDDIRPGATQKIIVVNMVAQDKMIIGNLCTVLLEPCVTLPYTHSIYHKD